MQHKAWLYGVILFIGFSLGMFSASLIFFFNNQNVTAVDKLAVKDSINLIPSVPVKGVQFLETQFEDLPGWKTESLSGVIPVLKRSCASLMSRHKEYKLRPTSVGGTVVDWEPGCSKLVTLDRNDESNLREVLLAYFTPHAVVTESSDRGRFTGYYQPSLQGSLKWTKIYNTPLYEEPTDMVQIASKRFNFSVSLNSLKGKIFQNIFVPYDTRKEIENAKLFSKRAKIIAWVNEVDAHLLHIQGSGHIVLENGNTLFVGYSNNNGHKFRGIGSILLNAGVISRSSSSMQDITKWLKANPKLARYYMQQNPRFIFFQRLNQPGAVGSAGIVLEPEHSLAVDPEYIPFGAPLWLDVIDADQRPLNRLVVALDSGAAIKGAIRGDFYWGLGPEAFAHAGRLNSLGRYYLILPQSIQPNL